MSIKYFPNRVFKKSVPAIDRVMSQRHPKMARGCANVATNSLSAVISSDTDWQINSVQLTFSNAAPRDYSARIKSGIKIVSQLNDYLWFQSEGTFWQKIYLDSGFYTGTELASQLQTKLNANTAFNASGITFTVTYDSLTGLFSIASSSLLIKYIQTNNAKQISERDSIAGHLFGLTANTNLVSTIVSDTPMFGLNEESWIIDEEGSTVTEHLLTDIQVLSMDQAIHVYTNVANIVVNYAVNFEELT
jgi:hypothetical protein